MTFAALLVALLLVPAQPAQKKSIEFFQATEQSLMDAIAKGDKSAWDQVMDPSCVVTTEEGQVLGKAEFLKELTGLPPGLSGSIEVKDLTVQEFADFAVVRFLLDEKEKVFGQQLATKYRNTDTFRKSGGAWKLIASHTSVVTIDPPAQEVSKNGWSQLVGQYKLPPDGWTFHVVLREGRLYGGRDVNKLREFIPLAPNVFVLTGSLGEWIFVTDKGGKATKIVGFRKFESLVWTRVSD